MFFHQITQTSDLQNILTVLKLFDIDGPFYSVMKQKKNLEMLTLTAILIGRSTTPPKSKGRLEDYLEICRGTRSAADSYECFSYKLKLWKSQDETYTTTPMGVVVYVSS